MSYNLRSNRLQQQRLMDQLYTSAFKTKERLMAKKSDDHSRFDEDKTFQLHLCHPPASWFCDIIYLDRCAYFLYVHANSRYAIIHLNSLTPTGPSDDLFEIRDGGVKSTQVFIESLKSLIDKNKVVNLISDYELGFRSEIANKFYDKYGINHIAINTREEGHNKLGILDRVVRTLRDMIFNTKIDPTDPVALTAIVSVYNNTRHATLTKILGTPTRPFDVFNSEKLEFSLIHGINSENYAIQQTPGYDIPDGTEVVVKCMETNELEKKRRGTLEGKWFVLRHYGHRYVIKNNLTNEEKSVYRSQIYKI